MTALDVKEKIKYELRGMINCLSDNEVKLLFTSYEYNANSLSECDKIIKKYGFSVFGHGATKNTFIFNFNTGFIIKTPILFIREGKNLFKRLVNNSETDSCEKEKKLFEVAKDKKVESFFLPSERIVSLGGKRNFYISEKLMECPDEDNHCWDIVNITDTFNKEEKDKFNLAIEKYIDYTDLSMTAAAILYKQNPDNFLDFLRFVKEYDINDLYLYNMGFDNNGKLKIFDYSGLDDDSWEQL